MNSFGDIILIILICILSYILYHMIDYQLRRKKAINKRKEQLFGKDWRDKKIKWESRKDALKIYKKLNGLK